MNLHPQILAVIRDYDLNRVSLDMAHDHGDPDANRGVPHVSVALRADGEIITAVSGVDHAQDGHPSHTQHVRNLRSLAKYAPVRDAGWVHTVGLFPAMPEDAHEIAKRIREVALLNTN